MKLKLILLLTLIVSLMQPGCGEKDRDKLGDAQNCLDKSAPSTAKACMDKISGNESAAAYTLRCASVFIAQGFDKPDRYISAFDQLNQNPTCPGGCSSTLGLMQVLSFSANGSGLGNATQRNANLADSAEAFNYCQKSGSQSYYLLSSIVRSATILNMSAAALGLGGGGTPTQAELEAAAAAIAAGNVAVTDIATPAVVGAIVTSTYETSCANAQNQSADQLKLCTELSTAISASPSQSADDIGACILKKWQNPAATCP